MLIAATCGVFTTRGAVTVVVCTLALLRVSTQALLVPSCVRATKLILLLAGRAAAIWVLAVLDGGTICATVEVLP